MTASTIATEPPDANAALPAPRRPGQRAVTATAAVALIAVVASLIGIGLLSRPLSTPTQDCGTAASYLLGGKVNRFVDPANPPKGTTKAEAEANNATPCQERAARRARPAGALVVGGALVALIALGTEVAIRFGLRRRAGQRWLAEGGRPAPPAAP